ncbi:aminoglycoside phosphotransferase family protein [Actinoplanes sp. RD1]|uniref:aminoglycoside phosphotransferase family protein n=1 Tax=Actinoplanes sp. RD1 TaxID=3064538 RepID=UPI00274156EF|nr:aminoglycoside phosphotransferase family protein [Actinoplanes sp. RD1]
MTLHQDEVTAGPETVTALLAAQCPQWAGLPLRPAGAGTENTMWRLGDDLLVRLPRTAEKAAPLRKERTWLPRLAPQLSLPIPEPVFAGAPGPGFPLPWAVFRWIDGSPPGPGTVTDWPAFGADLAAFVRQLHAIPLAGATRGGELSWYRGGSLRDCAGWDLQLTGRLAELWQAALTLPDPDRPPVWLHGDLRPANLLARDGRLAAVIDFGALSVGWPDAEHAAVWDLPAPARAAYREALALDDLTWQRARAWAIVVGASGVVYYRDSWPEFVAECRARLDAVIAES